MQRTRERDFGPGQGMPYNLSVTMTRTGERMQAILEAGLYRKAKKAKFRQIVFTDFSHRDTVVDIR